jgi:post-segregation antitoxin (ccd killing protein)
MKKFIFFILVVACVIGLGKFIHDHVSFSDDYQTIEINNVFIDKEGIDRVKQVKVDISNMIRRAVREKLKSEIDEQFADQHRIENPVEFD